MQKRARTRGLAALLTVSALAWATACGGSGDGATPDATHASERPSVLTSRLDPLVIKQSDLKGYTVSDQQAGGQPHGGQPRSTDPACQPLADSTGDQPSTAAEDAVRRSVNKIEDPAKGVTVGLSTYAKGEAKALVSELKAAVAVCGGGFQTTLGRTKVGYRAVRPVQVAAQRQADEVFGYTMTALSEGERIVLNFVVVRCGKTVALFTALDLKNYSVPYAVPRQLVQRQVERLTD